MNPYLCILVALLSTASVGLAQAPHSSIITGEVHNTPSREIEFYHEPLLAPGPSEHPIVLDEQNRFALLLNIPKGVLGTGIYKGEQYFFIPFFVEPGDSLHAVVTFAEVTEADSSAVESDSLHSAADEASSPYSLTFSGRGAENNRFLAEFWPQHRSFKSDHALEPEEFARQVKQQRRDRFALLAEGRERYALSPGFIDYMTAFLNYKWADQMISYPMFVFRNGNWVFSFNVKPSERRAVPPDYYDFLQEIPLIDEKAIGVRGYRSFLVIALDLEAKWDRPPRLADRYKLSGLGLSPAVHAQLDSMYDAHRAPRLSQKIDLSGLGLSPDIQSQLYSILAGASSLVPPPGIAERYDRAQQKLQGRVLYWFLAGELRNGIRDGYEAYVDARWQFFAESNPFPEYTEAIKAVFTLQPGQPAPDFTLNDLDGQPVSLSQFKGKVVLLDFWASWCGPCIADLGTLRKIKEQMASQPVVFLNVSLDSNDGAWKQAIAKHQIQGVHVRSGGHSEQVAQAYNVGSLPRYYLVDPQGLIVENNLSLFDTDEVVAKIEENL